MLLFSLHETQRAHLGLLLSATIVGLSFPIVAQLSPGLPPLLLTALRFAIAALALWPWVRKQPDLRLRRHHLPLYLLTGLCSAGFFGTMFWATPRSSALTLSTLFVCIPLLSYLSGRIARVEPYARGMAGKLLLGAAGALGLIWAQSGNTAAWPTLGTAEQLFLLGCLATALSPVITKWGLNRSRLPDSTAVRTFWGVVFGGILIGVAGLLIESPADLTQLAFGDVALLIYLGIFSSGLTFGLAQYATAVLSPATVKAYSYFAPFIAMLLLFIQDPSQMGWHWIPGSALVIFTMTLLIRQDLNRPSPAFAAANTAA